MCTAITGCAQRLYCTNILPPCPRRGGQHDPLALDTAGWFRREGKGGGPCALYPRLKAGRGFTARWMGVPTHRKALSEPTGGARLSV
jgi:hypothetical protein